MSSTDQAWQHAHDTTTRQPDTSPRYLVERWGRRWHVTDVLTPDSLIGKPHDTQAAAMAAALQLNQNHLQRQQNRLHPPSPAAHQAGLFDTQEA